jgi:hypothetical protein
MSMLAGVIGGTVLAMGGQQARHGHSPRAHQHPVHRESAQRCAGFILAELADPERSGDTAVFARIVQARVRAPAEEISRTIRLVDWVNSATAANQPESERR